jgi:hypothetical protein
MYRLIITTLILCLSPRLIAHVGSHSADISIQVVSALFTDRSAQISLVLRNKSLDPILIESITTNVGEIDFALNYPLKIAAKSQFNFTNSLNLIVNNTQNIPQIFTLMFNFGDAGTGPVTVIPTAFKE